MVGEVASFVTTIPNLIVNLQSNLIVNNLDVKFHLLSALESSEFVQSISSGAAGSIVSVGVTVAGTVADALVVLVLTLFFLAGYPQVKAGAYRLAPASRRLRVRELGGRILKQIGGYLAGAIIVAARAGLVAGLVRRRGGAAVPVGDRPGALPCWISSPSSGPWWWARAWHCWDSPNPCPSASLPPRFYICQHLFAYWFHPRVMRRQVDISTGAVVVAIVVGRSAARCVVGAVLAVPVAAAVQLIVREVVGPHQGTKLNPLPA